MVLASIDEHYDKSICLSLYQEDDSEWALWQCAEGGWDCNFLPVLFPG